MSERHRRQQHKPQQQQQQQQQRMPRGASGTVTSKPPLQSAQSRHLLLLVLLFVVLCCVVSTAVFVLVPTSLMPSSPSKLLRQQDKPTATNTKNNDQSSSNHSTKSEYSDDIKAISSNTQTIGSERPHGSNRNSNNTARQHSGQPANTLSLAAVATVVQPPVAAATVGVIDGGIVQVEAATAQIAALNSTEHDCEQQVVGVPSDRSPEAWSSARNASFYYCTINWKVKCKRPPCITEGERNRRWYHPVLFANFFYEHTMEMQVNDIFLKELDEEHSSTAAVLDIGSNTGWFSQVSASLGYEVHAIDVQPLCLRHVLTSAHTNGFEKLVHIHNTGLSTAAGKMEMLLEQCKGGLSFDLSQADEHKRAVIHGHEVEQRMVPLTTLDDFIVAYLGRDRTVQLVKMDTEGSEIDILRSGMQIFRSKRVHALVVELGVRHWVENKNISLHEGVDLLTELAHLFGGVHLLADPALPVSADVLQQVPAAQMPQHIRGPLYAIKDLHALVQDRYDKSKDCNLYFHEGGVPLG